MLKKIFLFQAGELFIYLCEQWTGKNVEGSGGRWISGTSLVYALKGWQKSQDNWCPSRDSNQVPPEYKSEMLPFEPVWYDEDACGRF
jgi:hypothetical protein